MFIPLVGTIFDASIWSMVIGLLGFVVSKIVKIPYLTPISVIGFLVVYLCISATAHEDDFYHFLYALRKKEITD